MQFAWLKTAKGGQNVSATRKSIFNKDMHYLNEWRGCMRIVIYNPLQFICHCGVFKEVCIVCTSYISYNLRWVSSFITWPQEQKKDIIARESLVLISQLPFNILINDCICTTVSPWIWLMNRPHTYIDKYTTYMYQKFERFDPFGLHNS